MVLRRVMLLIMECAVLESPVMGKKPEKEKEPEAAELVRYTALMRPEDRHRFRVFCVRIGANMERIGAQWILDRLAAEEKKLGK